MTTEILAVYDISDPRRLRRIAKLMEKFGVRVQKSVFECSLTEAAFNSLKQNAMSIMDMAVDSLRIYPLLADSRNKQTHIGACVQVEFPTAFFL